MFLELYKMDQFFDSTLLKSHGVAVHIKAVDRDAPLSCIFFSFLENNAYDMFFFFVLLILKETCHRDLFSFQKPKNVFLSTKTCKLWSKSVMKYHPQCTKAVGSVSGYCWTGV